MLLFALLVSAVSETASATLRKANLDAINSDSGQPCESDHDCSLNGRCQDRRCQCDIPWSGVDCGVLTTPQLHHIVRHRNGEAGAATGVGPLEAGTGCG